VPYFITAASFSRCHRHPHDGFHVAAPRLIGIAGDIVGLLLVKLSGTNPAAQAIQAVGLGRQAAVRRSTGAACCMKPS